MSWYSSDGRMNDSIELPVQSGRKEADLSLIDKFPEEWILKAQTIAQAEIDEDNISPPKAYALAQVPYETKELKAALKPLGIKPEGFKKLIEVQRELINRENLTQQLSDWQAWKEWQWGGGAVAEKLKKIKVRCDPSYVNPIADKFLELANSKNWKDNDKALLKFGLRAIGAMFYA